MTLRSSLRTSVLLSATFMQFLDVSIVNVAVPSIRHSLGASIGATELVASGYTLAYACTLITAGRLGDRYGYRRLYGLGMAVFTLASLLCAVSPNVGFLVAARIVQGLGSGLMAPQVLSIIQVGYPEDQRGRVFGAYGSAIGLATVTGPVLGGLLIGMHVPTLDWRLVFAINLPVGIGALWGLRLLPSARRGAADGLDPVGVCLAVAGLAMLVYPLAVGRQDGWPVWTVTMLCGGPIVLAGLVFHQLGRERAGRPPLLHLLLLRMRRVRVGLVVMAAFFAGVPPFFFLLSVYLQAGFGHSALAAGVAQLPFAVMTAVGSWSAARMTRRFGPNVLVMATAALAACMLVLALIVRAAGSHGQPWQLAPPMLVGGLAFGVFTASAMRLLLADVPAVATGSASGLLTTAQQAAGSVGLTLGGMAFYAFQPPLLMSADQLSVRQAYATGFFHTLIYEVIVFAVACVGAVVLLGRQGIRVRPGRPLPE